MDGAAIVGAKTLVLGVDTCGPSGSVALARIEGDRAAILGRKELAGRSYSATLIASVRDLLAEHGEKPASLGVIVVVNGPGSFTGVRVGLSAVKGLAEPGQIPVVAVSRLGVLAAKAGVESAALDAHRREVFLRFGGAEASAREWLAGAEELRSVERPPERLTVCDESAAELMKWAWEATTLVRCEAPTAADAIAYSVPRILRSEFDDLALLDGHYLRRSDAEIFGESLKTGNQGTRVRRMAPSDIEGVLKMALASSHAPQWPRAAYERAIDATAQPRRVALVAEASATLAGFAVARVLAPEAELESIVTAAEHRRRGVAREVFSALKNELRHQEVGEILLEVRAGNAEAVDFYRYLGFAEEGRRFAYYADPVEDAVLMRLRIR